MAKHIAVAEQDQDYFGILIERINDLVQVVAADGSVQFSSSRLESLTGWSPEEARQLPPFHWIHPEDRDRVAARFAEQISTGFEYYRDEYRLVAKDGQIRHVETKVTNALDNVRINGFIAVVRDITHRIEAEDRIKKQRRLYALMTDISKRFLNEPLEAAARYMLTEIGQFAAVDRAYVYLYDASQAYYHCLYEWRNPAGERYPSMYYENGFAASAAPWMQRHLEAGLIINFTHIDELPPEAALDRKLFEADSTQSLLLIPLRSQERVLGFIGFDSVLKTKEWQDDDITALRICTEVLTSTLLRAEAERATAQSLSVNRAIIESTAEGILVTDLQDRVITHNRTFLEMWSLPAEVQVLEQVTPTFHAALGNVINDVEVLEQVRMAVANRQQHLLFTVYMKTGRVIECITKPQIIDGEVVGRVWSNRDVTDRIQAAREEREKGIALAQFESLRNQVNPHFLFNSLNVLSSLVHIDAELSEKFIDQLARSYRYLLEQKDQELVPLRTEIDFIQSFTFLLKIRFAEKLRVEIQLSPAVLDYRIAPLTLQLLIENAVKHNIIAAETPLVIEIREDAEDYLLVRNNFQPRESRLPSTGLGQRNISSRYQLLTPRPVTFAATEDFYLVRIPLIRNIPT